MINDGDDVKWLVHVDDGRTLRVPNNKSFTRDAISNWLILNIDCDDDWRKLQTPGEYHVRTYGIRSLISDDNIKIIRVLDSVDEKPILVSYFNGVKKIVTPLFNSMKKYAIALINSYIEEGKELDEYLKDK